MAPLLDARPALARALLAARVAIASLAACSQGAPGQAPEPRPSTSAAAPSTVPPPPVPSPGATPTSAAPTATSDAPLSPLSAIPSFAPIARHADPSVVTILTAGTQLEPAPFFSHRAVQRETQGLGTGFIVEKSGVIVTNNHVIKDAERIIVRLSNDHEYEAKVVGRDRATDIAAVRIDEKNLVPLALGDSDSIEVGDWVVAIGNPFGLSHTVSAGIISAKGRTQKDVELDPTGYYNFLQTDASINPGNSGGPLLNLRGEVVGINTAIRGGGAQGIGFAIPINMVKQLLPMLLRDGHITRSALGVRIVDVARLPPTGRAELKLPADAKGAYVQSVVPGGPAAKAGVRPGDVIDTFEGTPIEGGGALGWKAGTAGVGRAVTVGLLRDGKRVELSVTLGVLEEAPASREEALP